MNESNKTDKASAAEQEIAAKVGNLVQSIVSVALEVPSPADGSSAGTVDGERVEAAVTGFTHNIIDLVTYLHGRPVAAGKVGRIAKAVVARFQRKTENKEGGS